MHIPENPLLFLPVRLDMIQQPPFCELSISPFQLLALLFLFACAMLFPFPSIFPIKIMKRQKAYNISRTSLQFPKPKILHKEE